MIRTTIRITLNLDQNDACSHFAFFGNFVKAGFTVFSIATYSAMGFFACQYASRRAVVLKLGSTEPQGFGEAVAGVRLRSE